VAGPPNGRPGEAAGPPSGVATAAHLRVDVAQERSYPAGNQVRAAVTSAVTPIPRVGSMTGA
jgi:hypothetical protein